MTKLMKNRKISKEKIHPVQKKFNQSRKKLTSLYRNYETQSKEIGKALQYYEQQIVARQKQLAVVIQERILITYALLQEEKKSFNKVEKKSIEELISQDLELLVQHIPIENWSQEISVISKKVKFNTKLDEMQQNFQDGVDVIANLIRSMGAEADLSSMNYRDSFEELMSKLLDSFNSGQKESEKTEDYVQEPLTEQCNESNFKKCIYSTYKKLVKILHPDLEQDPVKKEEKEQTMKLLTAAYESEDLYMLLSMEEQFLHSSDQEKQGRSLEQMALYSDLLKRQILALEEKIASLILSPQYRPILTYYPIGFTDMFPLIEHEQIYSHQIRITKATIKNLQTANRVEYIKQFLADN